MKTKPTAYILVGVPGAGKSTWINANKNRNTIVCSTDDHVEKYAKSIGKTYSEVFDSYMKTALKMMIDDVDYAILHDFNIIWDQTSTTAKARKKKINMLGGYTKIAVVFKTPDPGKHIPKHVMKSMIEGFEVPTISEGFDKIIHV